MIRSRITAKGENSPVRGLGGKDNEDSYKRGRREVSIIILRRGETSYRYIYEEGRRGK